MPRRILQDIQVQTSPDGRPRAFVWRGRSYRVDETLECWRESGCWWDGEPARTVFRIRDVRGETFELHRIRKSLFPLEGGEHAAGGWLLYGVED